ncbi:hypothetical protein EOD41_12960 [Mucilaginibacter limnophilus]|uniref:DUF6249 domain-containing protein n=1 Tax=Mucilaginibacter limnophilus TaxID=1932778 RepID=A0A437MRY3_9SPHI|nr:DUF6249 domain-containing protein [Mucilaginibacter limnophilus]RVU00383.1 hypothetical protein EOD41_12960 [Mucilaginibacter limnophilus]
MDPSLGVTLVFLGFLALIFGAVYLRNKERMAMIERGMDPRGGQKPTPSPYVYLKWAMLLIGSGVGLLFASVFTRTILVGNEAENTGIYFALIFIFGGIGLLISHLIEKKELHKLD